MVFPMPVRYVPEWFPGAGWKRKISKYKKSLQLMVDEPYEWAKKQMVRSSCSILLLYIAT